MIVNLFYFLKELVNENASLRLIIKMILKKRNFVTNWVCKFYVKKQIFDEILQKT
jgi:hypothetical protein